MKLGLVTSAGGHFYQLYRLKRVWEKHERFWVTFPKADVNSTISDEKKYYAYYPESRNLVNAVKNFILAFSILPKEKPEVLMSVGAGLAVPFFVVAKVLHIKTIYLEPIDFIASPSLTGKIIDRFRLADLFLIQDKVQRKNFRKAAYWGGTL